MPKYRPRARLLQWLSAVVNIRREDAEFRLALSDDDSLESMIDDHYESIFEAVQNQRYLHPRYYRERDNFDWEDCLSEQSYRFNDEEFLFHFRCTRDQFNHLHSLIKTHHIFPQPLQPDEPKPRGRVARPSHCQLLVFLFRVGRIGTGASDIAISSFFSIGKGTVQHYVENCIEAIVDLKEEFLKWPDQHERMKISTRLGLQFGFRRCVGIIDGTLLFLDKRPSKHGEAYFSRKCKYALTFLVVCDDQRNITYLFGGLPGSAHDNRLWKMSNMFQNKHQYFSSREYLAGDSAFSKCKVMVMSFKKVRDQALTIFQEFFNTKLGSMRVISEHTIGILKGRFPCLKEINMNIETREDIKKICRLVMACSIVHNIFNRNSGLNVIPQDWYDEMASYTEWAEDIEHVETNDLDYLKKVEEFDEQTDLREEVFNQIIHEMY